MLNAPTHPTVSLGQVLIAGAFRLFLALFGQRATNPRRAANRRSSRPNACTRFPRRAPTCMPAPPTKPGLSAAHLSHSGSAPPVVRPVCQP